MYLRTENIACIFYAWMEIIVHKKKIVIIKNSIAKKVSRYIDAPMNRATPTVE